MKKLKYKKQGKFYYLDNFKKLPPQPDILYLPKVVWDMIRVIAIKSFGEVEDEK